jgi:hypothetical protein
VSARAAALSDGRTGEAFCFAGWAIQLVSVSVVLRCER